MSLGGLASIAGGFAQGMDNGTLQRLREEEAKRMKAQQDQATAGVNLAGQTLFGGGAPGAQQPMAPGQTSTPGGQGGFGPAVAQTMKFEGGLNPSDTNGTKTLYGINQQANPGVDFSKLTPQGAQQIYKTKYWDAIGADKLPADMQKLAFDTAVVEGPGRAKQMIAQAQGDPQKLLALRQHFEQTLLQQNPEKYGKYAKAWAARDAQLGGQQGGQGQGSPQGQPQGQGALAQAVARIQQANPNATPAQKMGALAQIYPLLNKEEQLQVREQAVQQREHAADMLNTTKLILGHEAESGRNERSDAGNKLKEEGLQLKREQGEARVKGAQQKMELARQAAARATTRDEFNRKQKLFENARRDYEDAQKEATQGQTAERALTTGGVDRSSPEGGAQFGRAAEQQIEGKSRAKAAGQEMGRTRPTNEDAQGEEPARAPAPGGDPPRVASDADYAKLRPGTVFMGADGKKYRKP